VHQGVDSTASVRSNSNMYRAQYRLKWDVQKQQEAHQRHLRNIKPQVDNKCPRPQPHLVTKAKKHELEEDRFAEIERENSVLLSKMSKIMREGPGTHSHGGAPPVEEKPRPPQSLNRGFRRRELQRITQENQGILKRIQLKDPFYNHLDWAEEHRRSKRIMENLCEFKPQHKSSKFVRSLRGQTSGASTARDAPKSTRRKRKGKSGSVTARSEAEEAQQVRLEDLKLLLGMRRPPELVKKVFSALMILVSPFEASEADICWEAVQHWLTQLKGVQQFTKNLNHFEASRLDPSAVIRTVDYLLTHDLHPESVAIFSGALCTLARWIWGKCEEALPGVSEERVAARNVEEELPSATPNAAAPENEQDYGFANGEPVNQEAGLKHMSSPGEAPEGSASEAAEAPEGSASEAARGEEGAASP